MKNIIKTLIFALVFTTSGAQAQSAVEKELMLATFLVAMAKMDAARDLGQCVDVFDNETYKRANGINQLVLKMHETFRRNYALSKADMIKSLAKDGMTSALCNRDLKGLQTLLNDLSRMAN